MNQANFLPPEEEATLMLRLFPDWTTCYQMLSHHFDALQTRTQMMLTLGTLTLTITGFSGPSMAQSNSFSRYSIVAGIILVLASIVTILLSVLKIRWLTQVGSETPKDILILLIERRNKRTRWFHWQLIMLTIGLACYVFAVIAFLFLGGQGG